MTLTAGARQLSAPDSLNVVCRGGDEFYLGHLTCSSWIDARDAHAVWCPELAAESVSNLFCLDGMPDRKVSLTVESYDRVESTLTTTTASLRYILGKADGCDVYVGIDTIDADAALLEAVVVFHNPALAFIHKLDLTVDTASLFEEEQGEEPPLKARLTPYIKLHNLLDLWGEKRER